MARRLRFTQAGGWQHVINRGIDRQRIYADDQDRAHFVELLGEMSRRYGVEVHAYVLMGNHYHLILRVPDGNLSRSMQWLNVSYSLWYNRRRGRVGPLFQGRFKSVPIEEGRWLYALSQYVHLNPVRVKWLGLDQRGRRVEGLGLRKVASAQEATERLATLRGHRWSTYRYYAGYARVPQWLKTGVILERAGGADERARQARYRGELEAYVRGGYEEAWARRLGSRLAVGADVFREGITRSVREIGREWPKKRELKRRVGFEAVVKAVEAVKREPWAAFERRHGDWGRDMGLKVAREVTGMTLRELGQAVGGLDYAAVSEAVRRLTGRLKHEPTLKAVYGRVINMLNI